MSWLNCANLPKGMGCLNWVKFIAQSPKAGLRSQYEALA